MLYMTFAVGAGAVLGLVLVAGVFWASETFDRQLLPL